MTTGMQACASLGWDRKEAQGKTETEKTYTPNHTPRDVRLHGLVHVGLILRALLGEASQS